MTTILKIQAPRFGAHVRIRHSETTGTFAGLTDRKNGHVRTARGLRTYPLSDIIEIQAPAGGER